MSGRGYDLGAPAGALDQGGHILGAGEHVVVRGGDGGKAEETADRIQMVVEILVDLFPGACHGAGLRPSRPPVDGSVMNVSLLPSSGSRPVADFPL